MVAAGFAAGVGAIFLVGNAFAGEIAHTIYRGAIAVAVDGGDLIAAEKIQLHVIYPGHGLFDHRAGAAAAGI